MQPQSSAKIPEVRAALLDFQRDFARQEPGAVLDGRDIGTVVLPNADVKIFVVADTAVRAKRRFEELHARGEPVHIRGRPGGHPPSRRAGSKPRERSHGTGCRRTLARYLGFRII